MPNRVSDHRVYSLRKGHLHLLRCLEVVLNVMEDLHDEQHAGERREDMLCEGSDRRELEWVSERATEDARSPPC